MTAASGNLDHCEYSQGKPARLDTPHTLLVVDDTPSSLKLTSALLASRGYRVRGALSGEDALSQVDAELPDLVLLDVVMPGMDGFEVCRRLRARAGDRVFPIVMLTSLDGHAEKVAGLESGADDFLSKPVSPPELFARVNSLLRIKQLYDQVTAQSRELAIWNATLEARVSEAVQSNEKLSRLKRFLSPQLADLVVAGGASDPLVTHRREIAVVYVDLRGFTAFAESIEPERVMQALREYHAVMGRIIQRFGATLERFTGDGMMVFLNDPVPIPDPALRAVDMALAMRDEARALGEIWRARGFDLGIGIGVAHGLATIGAIGFEQRIDYGAIGTVTNLAARLCAEAPAGEIYCSQHVHAEIDGRFATECLGDFTLRGLARPQGIYKLLEHAPA